MSIKEIHKRKIPIIKANGIIPFGKYKGQSLVDVYYGDPFYFQWMLDNVSNYQFDVGPYLGWKDILDKNDIVPKDGIYIIACRGDMHLIFEIYDLKKGDRFCNLYEGDNIHYNGWVVVDCLAYHYIPEYNKSDIYWVDEHKDPCVDEYGHEHNFGLITIAVIQKDTLVYILPHWDIDITLSKLNELDYCDPNIEGLGGGIFEGAYSNTKFKEGIEYTFEEIKGFIHIPAYTEEMHIKHWDMVKQITNNNTPK